MRKAALLAALVGAALFVWVIQHMGLSAILQQLKALRFALPILIALSLCRLLLQTVAWSTVLKAEGITVALTDLIGIRLASQSMGYLTVLGPVLSEPMKIQLLGTAVAPTITATFLDSGVYWLTSALLGMAGCISIALLVAHGGYLTSAAALFAIFALALLLITRRKPILSSVAQGLRRSPAWLKRAEKIEGSLRDYRVQHPAVVSRMFWIDVACQFLMASEVAVVLWALWLPIHVITVLAIEGFTRAVKMATGWVPARLGADEGGAMSAFMAIGLQPAFGLTLALTRRTRDLLWAATGLAWLAWRSQGTKNQNKSIEQTLESGGKELTLCNSLLSFQNSRL